MNERRETSRSRVYLGGRIVHPFLRSDTKCLLRNLSSAGARVIVSGAILLPSRFLIVIDCHGITRPVQTVWRIGDEMGVCFVTDASERNGIASPAKGLMSDRLSLADPGTGLVETDLQAQPSAGALH